VRPADDREALLSTGLRARLASVPRRWRALSPITRAILVVYALIIGLQWTFRYAPGETPLELAEVEAVDEPIIVVRSLSGGERLLVASLAEPGYSVLDWTHSGELAHSADLGALPRVGLDVEVLPHQGLFTADRMDLLSQVERELVHYRFGGDRVGRTVAPTDALWIAPDGKLFRAPEAFYERAEQELRVRPLPTPVWRTGRWAMLRGAESWYRDAADDDRSKTASNDLLLFDAQTGAPHEKVQASKLRKVFAPPSWSGFLYTYASGRYLRYIACEDRGCSAGDLELVIDHGEITAADYHPAVHRIAVCQGTSLWLYEGSHDDVSLLLGRGTLPEPCIGAWIASADTLLLQLETLKVVVARFQESR
jgi:hypothetical protein